jgi:microcin C transport system substrate-binding protein
VRDGALRNAKGEAMVLEYLDSQEAGARTVTPWSRNLAKLGIEMNFRPVDYALYQQRLRTFKFDITTLAFGGTHNPGPEYADLFGSKAADTEDSSNMAGVKSPAVDAMIARMIGADTPADFIAACRSLERVITHSHFLIPQWSASTHRMVYNSWRLARPEAMPPYAAGEDWAIDTWWSKP